MRAIFIVIILLNSTISHAAFDLCESRAYNSIIDFYLKHKANYSVGFQDSKIISKSGNLYLYEITAREFDLNEDVKLLKFHVQAMKQSNGNCVASSPVFKN